MIDLPEGTSWNFDALQAALEEPRDNLDFWLAFDRPGTQILREWLSALPGRGPESLATAVARMVLDISGGSPSAAELAERIGVEPSAISQRKSRILRDLQRWSSAPDEDQHDLTLLWRRMASRAVRVVDLPEWMQRFSTFEDPARSDDRNESWGTNRDMTHLILHLAMGRPIVMQASKGADLWLVDRLLLPRPDASHSLADVVTEFADSCAGAQTHVFDRGVLFEKMIEWGVSSRSTVAFLELLGLESQRSVTIDHMTVIFTREEARRGGTMAHRLVTEFDLSDREAAQLLSDQQGRNVQSVLNDLRAGR